MEVILRNANKICETDLPEVKQAAKRLIEMAHLAKNEGLFALETFLFETEDFLGKHFVECGTEYILRGMSWENIDTLLTYRIQVMDDEKKQYICFLYKEGLSLIQKDRFVFIGDYIGALIPEKYEKEVVDYVEEMQGLEYKKWFERNAPKIEERFWHMNTSIQEMFVEEMTQFETELQLLPNHIYTQAWLRRMENTDVCYLLLAGSGTFREAVLSNMSIRLKIQIMKDVLALADSWNEAMGEDIKRAIQNGKKAYEGM